MINFTAKDRYTFDDLIEIMKILRSPEGCPWDREQDHQSILRNFHEETYEFCDAAQKDDPENMCEELGDVLMQVVFHACMEEEQKRFTIEDVCDGICKKMVFRHPHVFGNTVHCENSEEVLNTWEQVKRVEKAQKTTTDSMDSIPKNLPALWRAEKIERKAIKAGFKWDSITGALDKLEEEVRELRAAIEAGQGQEEELGDVLFAACGVSAMLQLDPEAALHAACDKFIRRFTLVEQSGQDLSKLAEEELVRLWKLAKQQVEMN